MKNTALVILLLLISCKGKSQENSKKFDTTTEIITDDKSKNSKTEAYHTYLTVEKDTVLLSISKYIRKNIEKDTIIYNSTNVDSVLLKNLNSNFFLIKYIGDGFLIKKDKSSYHLISKIPSIREIIKDKSGKIYNELFMVNDIKFHKDNLYVVPFNSEGNFKIGIYEITEKGFIKKFVSKGCLFFDEWSDFNFYNIKKDKIFVNYLKNSDTNEISAIELKYENGKYSLNKDQCGEWASK